jgi:hypothetical protein
VSAHTKLDENTGELLIFGYSADAPYMHYGVVDPEGVARVEWRYRLLHPDRRELAARRDTMREASGDRTAVLVHSDEMGKGRALRFDPGVLMAGERYVLWITAFYRGAILHETLVAIDEGVPYVDPIDPAKLPELLNSF